MCVFFFSAKHANLLRFAFWLENYREEGLLMLHVIGIGPGSPEWLPPAISELVLTCNVLIGGNRALNLFPDFQGEKYCLTGDLESGMAVLKKASPEKNRVGVLVSGDPGFFSLLPRLKKVFPERLISVHPGISSLQLVFARAGLPWQEAAFVSVHGRELSLLPRVIRRPTAVLTGGENTPQRVARYYLKQGLNPRIAVGNALTYPEEFWTSLEARDLAREDRLLKNAVLILYPTEEQGAEGQDLETADALRGPAGQGKKGCCRLGIPDEEFLRGNVPMTKAEIRVQVLAKAQIAPVDWVVDVGAGTGSISVEAAGWAAAGKVYAIEQNPEAQELILANRQKFAVSNLQLIEGVAPDVFGKLPPVDVCIIGGSNGRLREIVQRVPLVAGGRMVITAATIETVARGLALLQELNYRDIDVVSIQAVRWKAVSALHMAQALNPVFILSAYKGEET